MFDGVEVLVDKDIPEDTALFIDEFSNVVGEIDNIGNEIEPKWKNI